MVVSLTSVKVLAAGSHSCTAALVRSHARTFPFGRSAMWIATMGHVNGPAQAPFSWA